MFCILILWLASPLRIPGKSRMRKRARTDLCGGRSAMVVPTATSNSGPVVGCRTSQLISFQSHLWPTCPYDGFGGVECYTDSSTTICSLFLLLLRFGNRK